jgi:MFS family permease
MSLLVIGPSQYLRRIAVGMAGITVAMLIMSAAAVFELGRMGGVSTNLILACIGSGVLGLALSSSLGVVNTVIQQVVPDELRGRVTSLQTLVFIGIMPFSSLLMSSIVDVTGMPWELIGAALLYGVGSLVLYRRLDTDEARQAIHGLGT